MIPETFRFLLRYKLLIVKSAVPLSLILLIGFAFLLVGFNLQSTIQNYEKYLSIMRPKAICWIRCASS